MKAKRLLSLLLCLLMLVTIFSACGQQKGSNQVSGSVVSSAEPASGAHAEAPKGDPVKLVLEKPIWGDKPIDDPTNEAIRQVILDKLNIDLTIVGQQNPGDQEEKAKLMLASGEQLDLFQAQDWTKFKKNDNIIPLNDLLDKYGQDIKKNSIPASLTERTDKDGKIWSVPYEQYPVSFSMLIRKDWLDECSLQVPTTIAEFENVMQVLKEKKKDEGFVLLWDTALEDAFASSFTKAGNKNFVDTDGKLKPNFLDPDYKLYLAKMQEWYKKGYIHKEAPTMQYQQGYDIFYGGRSSITMNWLKSIKMNEDQVKAKDPNGVLTGVGPLKGPKQGWYQTDLPAGWGTVITKSCANPEAAMKYINWQMATDEGYLLTTFGVEGKQWEWVDQTNNIIKAIPDPKADEYLGNFGDDTAFSTGVLYAFFSKYASSQRDKDFVAGWLNDKTKVNQYTPPDMGIMFDMTTMTGNDKFAALDTMMKEARWKIIMGQKSPDYWDEVVTKWLAEGGNDYIDGYTTQYREAKGIK